MGRMVGCYNKGGKWLLVDMVVGSGCANDGKET